jgi:hypothetical protein
MAQRLALLHVGVDAVFIGVAASVSRYAELISAQLPREFGAVRPIAIEDVRANGPGALGSATYAFSLVFHAREVENLLSERPIRVLSIMSRLEDGLLDAVPTTFVGGAPVLIARPETRPIYAELLRNQRPDLVDLPFVNDADHEAIATALLQKDVVLHTSAAAHVVRRLAGHQHLCVELRHIPQEKSLHHIVQTLKSDQELRLDVQRQHVASP